MLISALAKYIEGMRIIGISSPIFIFTSLQGVLGVRYRVERIWFDRSEPPLPLNEISLPVCVVDQYGSEPDYQRVVRPIFDALWNSIGRSKAESFNESGKWIGIGS